MPTFQSREAVGNVCVYHGLDVELFEDLCLQNCICFLFWKPICLDKQSLFSAEVVLEWRIQRDNRLLCFFNVLQRLLWNLYLFGWEMIQGWAILYDIKLLSDESCEWVFPECFLKSHVLKQIMINEIMINVISTAKILQEILILKLYTSILNECFLSVEERKTGVFLLQILEIPKQEHS